MIIIEDSLTITVEGPEAVVFKRLLETVANTIDQPFNGTLAIMVNIDQNLRDSLKKALK